MWPLTLGGLATGVDAWDGRVPEGGGTVRQQERRVTKWCTLRTPCVLRDPAGFKGRHSRGTPVQSPWVVRRRPRCADAEQNREAWLGSGRAEC